MRNSLLTETMFEAFFTDFDANITNLKYLLNATGSEVRGFKPGRGRWIFSERKNPEYEFIRKGSKSVGLVSYIYGT